MAWRFAITTGALLLPGVAIAQSFSGHRHIGLAESLREKYLSGSENGVNFRTPSEILATTNSTIHNGTIDLPLDHFGDSAAGTFPNRYWVQEKWYKPGGPVFIYDAGESPATGSLGFLEGDDKEESFMVNLMKEFGGMGIVWEHRYYGESLPEHKHDRTWLTVEQALADIPAFAKTFSRPKLTDIDLSPASTPWIMLGGSYPGYRAAYTRLIYPDTIYASWAASAPVQNDVAFKSYWYPEHQGMQELGYQDCLADVIVANKHIETLLAADDVTSGDIKEKFFGPENRNMSDGLFAYSLGFMPFRTWQAYRDEPFVADFCEALEDGAPEGGWAAAAGNKDPSWIVDRMYRSQDSWRVWGPIVFPTYDYASWFWQCCTETGWLQTTSSTPEQEDIILMADSVEWHKEAVCGGYFPNATFLQEEGWQPAASKLNEKYGGWNMRPSNTFWTGNQYDPWSTLSPLSDYPGAPRDYEISTDIPQCGVSSRDIFGHVLPGGVHYDEFGGSEKALKVQRLFTEALREWLPCWERGNA